MKLVIEKQNARLRSKLASLMESFRTKAMRRMYAAVAGDVRYGYGFPDKVSSAGESGKYAKECPPEEFRRWLDEKFLDVGTVRLMHKFFGANQRSPLRLLQFDKATNDGVKRIFEQFDSARDVEVEALAVKKLDGLPDDFEASLDAVDAAIEEAQKQNPAFGNAAEVFVGATNDGVPCLISLWTCSSDLLMGFEIGETGARLSDINTTDFNTIKRWRAQTKESSQSIAVLNGKLRFDGAYTRDGFIRHDFSLYESNSYERLRSLIKDYFKNVDEKTGASEIYGFSVPFELDPNGPSPREQARLQVERARSMFEPFKLANPGCVYVERAYNGRWLVVALWGVRQARSLYETHRSAGMRHIYSDLHADVFSGYGLPRNPSRADAANMISNVPAERLERLIDGGQIDQSVGNKDFDSDTTNGIVKLAIQYIKAGNHIDFLAVALRDVDGTPPGEDDDPHEFMTFLDGEIEAAQRENEAFRDAAEIFLAKRRNGSPCLIALFCCPRWTRPF